MTNYRDSHIFALGGRDSPYIIPNVDMYSIETDKWIAAPPLPKARAFLASCTLGDFLYVIGGITLEGKPLETIDRLNI